MLRLVQGLKIDSREVDGGSDEKLCFSEKERGNVWKDYMDRIMNSVNAWDDVEGYAVKGPVQCLSRDEVVLVLSKMKT